MADELTVTSVHDGSPLFGGNTSSLITKETNEKIIKETSRADFATTGTSLIEWGATITAPTKGDTVIDRVTWVDWGDTAQMRWNYYQTGGGNVGEGDYLVTLPNGYQFRDVDFYTDAASSNDSIFGWSVGQGYCGGGGSLRHLAVIPYNATQFRLASVEYQKAADFVGDLHFQLGDITPRSYNFEMIIKKY